jgi:hypothetical protein
MAVVTLDMAVVTLNMAVVTLNMTDVPGQETETAVRYESRRFPMYQIKFVPYILLQTKVLISEPYYTHTWAVSLSVCLERH